MSKTVSSLPMQLGVAAVLGFTAVYGFSDPQTSSQIEALAASTLKIAAGECDIKGNISFNGGERIYHVPGQHYYSQTQINFGKGERWFCSEAEALAAGWRRAGY